MDLMADSTEFLTGKAHRGMALGSNNIYERCKDAIIKGKKYYYKSKLINIMYNI